MLSKLRLWLTLHRLFLIKLIWVGFLLIFVVFNLFLWLPPLQSYWPILGRNFAKISAVFFCLTLIPGMLKRFNAQKRFLDIELSLMLFRRQLGIAMYFFAFYHFIFSRIAPILKYQGNLLSISPFELVGMIAFFLLSPLFLTSNRFSQVKLGRNWRLLHKLVYLIIWLILIHLVMQANYGPVTFILALTAILETASFVKGAASALVAGGLSFLLAAYVFAKPNLNQPATPLNPNASDSATAAALTSSPYSMASVAAHKTAADCWTVISGKVYNLSAYIPFHPGGQETILSACGTDATTAFTTKGGRGRTHLPSTFTLLSQYYLADLNSSSGTTPASPNFSLPPNLTPTPSGQSPLGGASPLPKGSNGTSLTTTTIATHNSQSDCWLIINGKVYNVTSYISFHPGGTQQIVSRCGTDATTAFNNRGGTGSHSQNAQSLLQNYLIGSVGTTTNTTTPIGSTTIPTSAIAQTPTTAPIPTANPGTALTASVVAQHNQQGDCWLIISNKVYNVTAYIPFHPGGTQRIVNVCGTEATTAFDTRGGSGSHSTSARNLLANYYLGDLNSPAGGGTSPTATPNPSSPTTVPNSGSGYSSPQAAILAQYPGANITEVNHEDNGYVVHFTHNGHEYEAILNSNYVITSVK